MVHGALGMPGTGRKSGTPPLRAPDHRGNSEDNSRGCSRAALGQRRKA